MPQKKTVIPRFDSEKEEAEWWDAHPEVATRLLKHAEAGDRQAASS